MLTGQTIGVFKSSADRRLAKSALSGAIYVGLRDRGISEADLKSIGISGDHIRSTCDDALLCPALDRAQVDRDIAKAGADPSKPWVAVNFHHWGQPDGDIPKNEQRFAEICDALVAKYGLQVVMIPMTPGDTEPEKNVLEQMSEKGSLIEYSPDYRVVRGVIAHSKFVLTFKHHPIVFAQGELVPAVGVALDDYYAHKNKGAMSNTGHDNLLVDSEEFFNDKIYQKLDEVIAKNDEIRKEISNWVGEMREIELDPYKFAQDELHKTGNGKSAND